MVARARSGMCCDEFPIHFKLISQLIIQLVLTSFSRGIRIKCFLLESVKIDQITFYVSVNVNH
jgi:hypothetical protein